MIDLGSILFFFEMHVIRPFCNILLYLLYSIMAKPDIDDFIVVDKF
jgi:hypothetical protein